MEKPQLINFIAKVMEESGFKVYKNFKTSQAVIDIYAVLSTEVGDFGAVVACNNYDKDFEVGINLLKDMENVQENLRASKVVIVTSSHFSQQAINYGLRKNIKLVDRDNLLELAKKYQINEEEVESDDDEEEIIDYGYIDVNPIEEEYPEYSYDVDDMEYFMEHKNNNPLIYENTLYRQVEEKKSPGLFSRFRNRNKSSSSTALTLHSNFTPAKQDRPSIIQSIKPHLGNPIVLVILVVLIAYVLAYLLGSLLGMDQGITGLIQLIVALILSYGFTFFFSQRNRYFIVHGTIVFFISLIILILLILFV